MTVAPTGPLSIVLVAPDSRSEALDPSMDFAKYAETRDPALIKEKPGMRAPRFNISPIKRVPFIENIDTCSTHVVKCEVAFAWACHEIDKGDGNSLKPDAADITTMPNGTKVAGGEWIEKVADEFGVPAIYEVGHVIYQRAKLKAGAAGPFFLWAGTGLAR
jgi:hypothetical protein